MSGQFSAEGTTDADADAVEAVELADVRVVVSLKGTIQA